MKKAWVRRAIPWFVALGLLGVVPAYEYHRMQQSTFPSRLDHFELTVRSFGMPGEPISEIAVTSDGSFTVVEAVMETRVPQANGTLTADEIGQIRSALAGLSGMDGEYRPAFGHRRTDPGYLSIYLKLGDGSVRDILLEGVDPPPVSNLMRVLDEVIAN